jgi:hypothetical protein
MENNRMENRDKLAEYFAELGFNIGAEIGVERGYFSEVLCKVNPNLKLYCIDAWQTYSGYRDHTRQDKLEKYYEETKQRLAPYNCEIIRDWSLDAANKIQDNSLDFAYLDANHDFRHVIEDIDTWSKKVRKGGIVAGHDYNRHRSSIECQVKDAIDAWGHAYNLKINVTGEPDFPSWWFVK